jgi:methionyl-tRNA formyltransferase
MLRVLFAGSPEISIPTLEAIAASHRVVGILTNPDSVSGRGKLPTATAVASRAETLLPGVPVLKPERLLAEAREAISALRPDILVAFAYGKIFGPKFLALFPKGGLNVHPSLLPRYRGATPIPAAILNREAETGVTVQRLALEMDSGDILAQERMALTGRETTGSLSARAAAVGAALLARVLADIEAGRENATVQDGSLATTCGLIGKDDGLVDWNLTAPEIDARVRAYDPWPGAFTFLDGTRLSILASGIYASSASDEGEILKAPGFSPAPGLEPPAPAGSVIGVDKQAGILVQTGSGIVSIERLQLQTKKALDWKSFLNGTRGLLGACLGTGHEHKTAV